ncbi:MAG: sugar phosphate isomerase/epimerase [Acidobacteriaceae bacterium]|nr:sugar phosphate isomerase/epimerase [Acidobacteriaceae bacterium]
MQDLKPLEPGVMFWADRDHLAAMKALGVRCGQLGIPGDFEITTAAADDWRLAMAQEQFTIVTVFAAYSGESYADIPTVERTVGFVPLATRTSREQRTYEVSDFAASLGVKSIACHVGFVPEDRGSPDYAAVRDLVRRVCDHAAKNGQTFALETGQEPAAALLRFLQDLERENAGINFDPANMILYGTGDPIEALDVLAPHILSVHCKDGDWPPKGIAGALGKERALGKGSVGMERFIAKLRDIGFRGPLNVEREAENQEERVIDMAMGVELVKRLTAEGQ